MRLSENRRLEGSAWHPQRSWRSDNPVRAELRCCLPSSCLLGARGTGLRRPRGNATWIPEGRVQWLCSSAASPGGCVPGPPPAGLGLIDERGEQTSPMDLPAGRSRPWGQSLTKRRVHSLAGSDPDLHSLGKGGWKVHQPRLQHTVWPFGEGGKGPACWDIY